MATLWRRLFGRGQRDRLRPLYATVVSAARQPAWYREGRVPDTLDGRFDMVAAILSLVLLRLEHEGREGSALGARLTELFVDDMDGQLRQAGIGDIIVGKHIGRMMGALGGRLGAFRDGLAADDLDRAIARNIYRENVPDDAALAMVRKRLAATWASLAATPLAALVDGDWRG